MKLKIFIITFFITFCSIYTILGIYIRQNPRFVPNIAKLPLDEILDKNYFTTEDYDILFEQTGITKPIIDELKTQHNFNDKMHNFQDNYFHNGNITREFLPPVTTANLLDINTGGFDMAPYRNGYIFFTSSTTTLNWRHGHCAIVVDDVRGLTLEALNPGSVSVEQPISRWKYYPTFKMYRLKDYTSELGDKIANYALSNLKGLPYNILADKDQGDTPYDTHCSLLIWQAFKPFGYDLDATGGLFVSPKNIAISSHLELLQSYGFAPGEVW